MNNKMNKGNCLIGHTHTASELLEGHVLASEKLVPVMERSVRSSVDGNSVEIGEITETPETDYMSTSAILHYCKSKILIPYLRLLSIMGLRPAVADASNSSRYIAYFSHFYSALVAAFMCVGYILQYMACFRRDRGFCYKLVPLALSSTLEYDAYRQVCYGNTTFTYIGPSVFHFVGFLYALYLFRISDNEQLQNLMERVFLLSSFTPQGTPTTKPKKLLRMLWLFISLSVLWMCVSLCSVNLLMAKGSIMFLWIEESSNVSQALKILLMISTLIHDMVQVTVITSYCIQAQLLQAHLMFLRERLLTRTISPLNWMREISEFLKLLKYLNDDLAPAACLFTIVNISWAVSGIMWLLNMDKVDTGEEPIEGISILNLLLWISAVVAPFIQAARLSAECRRTQSVGHELCVRPFLHQDTSQEDISSVLAYATSLKLRAKLFCYPIYSRYIGILSTLATIILFALGMCHYLQ